MSVKHKSKYGAALLAVCVAMATSSGVASIDSTVEDKSD